jgi:EmrB/QacA subfamily drug resistance transporter
MISPNPKQQRAVEQPKPRGPAGSVGVPRATPGPAPNRWAVLALLGVAQLMVTLDVTIVQIALPSAQRALHFSTDSRQWIITAYALAFGGLLVFGGKLGDLFGRKWTLIAGLVGFALASAIGGLTRSFTMLVAARALQGVFGALLAPSALGLLTITFAGSPDRPKAFGIFSAIAASGASVGLLLGGLLTQALSWRWCLYVNLIIAVPEALLAWRLLVNEPHPHRPHLDLPGLILGSGGVFALVYGFSNAETHSWGAPGTIVALAASAVALISFIAVEQRAASPLVPLHIPWNRARGGAYLSVLLAFSAVFSVFLFLSYFMQQNLGFSPLQTGVAFLPMSAAVALTATFVQTRLLPRTGAKPIVTVGMALALTGTALLTRLGPHASYGADILPSLILVGLGMGSVFAPSVGTATLGVQTHEAGIASALLNTAQQVGGSVGTALLSTIFASATAGYAATHTHLAHLATAAQVHGEATAFRWSTAMFSLGLLAAAFVLPTPRGWRKPRGQAIARSERGAQPTARLNPRPTFARAGARGDRGEPRLAVAVVAAERGEVESIALDRGSLRYDRKPDGDACCDGSPRSARHDPRRSPARRPS